jgi:2-polyprenyl-3-methyl-5-hydroxy-6-metoxy-1,4-benzoquinol methylase
LFSHQAGAWAACYSDPESPSVSARNLISRQRIALEMVEAGAPRAARVLDVGCGTGRMAATLMRRGYEVWGLDIAETMVRHAREHCGSDRFRVGDIERLPFRDHTFDAVVCLGVVEYLEVDERALHEIWRVLKPGGTAVVTTPNAICPFYPMARLLAGAMNAVRVLHHFVTYRLRGRQAPVGQAPREIHHRRYYRGQWLRLLRSVGLEPEEWVCHSWGWYSSSYRIPLASQLARLAGLFRPARVSRAPGGFVRKRALNWLLAEQVVRVRAVK